MFFLCCIGTLISTALSIFLLSSNTRVSSGHLSTSTNLHRPSTYVNLDRIVRNSTDAQFPPIHSFAHVVLQFDAADRSRTLREDKRWYPSDVGEIHPDDRHFIVSSEVH